jgi:hypothetical protein
MFCLPLFVFLFSLFFAPFYYDGDSIPYNLAYDAVGASSASFFDTFPIYKHNVNGSVIHYLYIWIGSSLGLERGLIMAIANSILAYLMMRLFLQWRVSIYIALVVILTNYYILGLYFAAERLKFGFIFLLVALIYNTKPKLSLVFAVTSIFAHAQQVLIYSSVLFSSMMANFLFAWKTGKFSRKRAYSLIIIAVTTSILLFFLGDKIYIKFIAYQSQHFNNITLLNVSLSLMKTFLLYSLCLLYSKERLEVTFIFVILLLASMLVGPDRVNIISFSFFLFYALQYKNGFNIGILLTTCYFAWKSVHFISQVLATGQGYG